MLQQALVMVVPLLAAVLLLPSVDGHGYVISPPQRSSMWRVGYNTPRNEKDDELWCGGPQRQWQQNGGKCGVCGDPYDDPERPHEAGGKYASGIVVGTYRPGDVINVTIVMTIHHAGTFVFKLCPNDDATKRVSQECLDGHVLQFVSVDGQLLGDRLVEDLSVKVQGAHLQLPSDLTCSQCVLQWTWQSENCEECAFQYTFVNCIDIAIQQNGGSGQAGNSETNQNIATTSSALANSATISTATASKDTSSIMGPNIATASRVTASRDTSNNNTILSDGSNSDAANKDSLNTSSNNSPVGPAASSHIIDGYEKGSSPLHAVSMLLAVFLFTICLLLN